MSNIIKSSSIYLFSGILNKGIPFLLLPILTAYLSPEEYGILSIFQYIIFFFLAFIGMNMSVNISKNFFTYSKQKFSLMIGNILIILSLTTLIYFIITLGFSFYYKEIFSIPSVWVAIIPLLSFMLMINILTKTILRNQERAYLFGVFEVVNTIINIGVTLLLLIMYNYGWYSSAFGIMVSYFIFFVISLLYMKNNGFIDLTYDKKEIKKILKLSSPLILHVLASTLLTMSDRFFIESMIDLEAVGIYSVGYTFGMIVLLFSNSFIKAWNPWFYKKLASPSNKNKKLIVKYSYFYILGILGVTFFVAIFGSYIFPYFIDEAYYQGAAYIFWISIGYAMFGIYQLFFPYLVHIGKTSFLAISTTIAAVLNLILNYLCINSFGAIGAAYATFFSYLVMFGLVSIYTQKHYKMPWFYMFK